MTDRQRGMDHAIYAYEPMDRRAPLRWPGGARVAFWVLLHLEYWEISPPSNALRDARFRGDFGDYSPGFRTWSLREYGNRVGIFRILDLLQRYGLKATVAVNAMACERYPALVAQLIDLDCELAAHGISATRIISSKMSEAEEREYIDQSVQAVQEASGRKPRGWLSQDFGQSSRTTALLAQAGLDYLMDWPNDDQPYRTTTEPSLVSIPNQVEWDDTQLIWLRRLPEPRYPEVVQDAFDGLYEEGARSGRLFCLSLHPWLMGASHRIRYLDEALARITGREAVWQTTAGEIASAFSAVQS